MVFSAAAASGVELSLAFIAELREDVGLSLDITDADLSFSLNAELGGEIGPSWAFADTGL